MLRSTGGWPARQAVATTAAKVAAPAVAAAAYAAVGSYLPVFVTVGMCSAVAVWALLRAASPSVEGALEAKTC